MATKDDKLEQVYAILTSRKHIRSIQAVAADHGFDDLTAFNAAFRERYQMSPSNVRRATMKRKIKLGAR